MRIDLSLLPKVNLEKLTKDIAKEYPNLEIGRIQSTDKDLLIIDADENLTKEQKKAIRDLIEAHAPERDDQEEVDYQEQKEFDRKLRAALIRLGVAVPNKDGL